MAILQSRIDPSSEAFRANRRDMLALVEEFRALEARVRDTSNQKLPMFQKRGQLTPRQRLAHLIDRGSPFLELSTLAGSTCTTTTAPRTSWAAAPSPASATSPACAR